MMAAFIWTDCILVTYSTLKFLLCDIGERDEIRLVLTQV